MQETERGLSYLSFVFVLAGAVPVMLFLFYISAIVWVKRKTKNATLIKWWDVNKEEHQKLVKLKGSLTVPIGDPNDENTPTFVIDTDRIHFSWWPPALPTSVQERVSTYYYRIDQMEPIDPVGEKRPRIVSPVMLTSLINEAVLKTSMREARENAEGTMRLSSYNIPKYILIGTIANLIISGGAAYLLWTQSENITEILRLASGG